MPAFFTHFINWDTIRDARTGGAGGATAPVALYQEGQGGQRCPFNLKDCLGEIANCQKCECNYFTNLLQKTQEMQSSSFKNSTIAWRRTPHTPIIQSIENMIRRSSTPDVSQTSLSIYQFKSDLSRKSAPLAFTSFQRPWIQSVASLD
jgi:hypothetical protein